MKKTSAGILPYRLSNKHQIEFFLVHPGGPFWVNKDLGSWSIVKGEFTEDEKPIQAAIREFKEETGFDINEDLVELSPLKQPSGKLVFAWAVEQDFEEKKIQSNTFELEWPTKSGKHIKVPEIDRAAWFNYGLAAKKILPGQLPFLQEILAKLKIDINENEPERDSQLNLF